MNAKTKLLVKKRTNKNYNLVVYTDDTITKDYAGSDLTIKQGATTIQKAVLSTNTQWPD